MGAVGRTGNVLEMSCKGYKILMSPFPIPLSFKVLIVYSDNSLYI